MPISHALPASWAATWISPAEPAAPGDADRPAYWFEATLDLAEAPTDAVWHVTALGIYEAFINDERVGDAELTPGVSNYDTTLYAQSYDVTSFLRPGTNTLRILVSDGWYRGRVGSERQRDSWGTTTAALAQLGYLLADGTTGTFGTDGSWTSRPSQIVRADLMDGQTTDFSRPDAPAVPVLVGTVDPPVPALSPAPPVRRIAELPAVRLTPLREGVSIADFGQNIAGWVRLSDVGAAGSRTTLEFGEHLDPDGDLDTAYLDVHTPGGEHTPFRQVDEVISGTGTEVFEPRHTVHGFRYARITHPGRTLDAAALTAVVVHTDFAPAGSFACSDERINALYDAVHRSWRGNAVDIPTDCPTRERQGWTGDYQVFMTTAALMDDVAGFTRKWLQAVRDDQFDDGCLAMFSPDTLRLKHSTSPSRVGGGSAGWGDAAVAVPWELYEHTGNLTVLEESWDSASAWVDYALACAKNVRHPSRVARSAQPAGHERLVWDGPFHFGEWCEPRDPGAGTDNAAAFAALMAADHGEVGTAYLYRSLSQLAAMAARLGKQADAERLSALATRTREAWRTEFWYAAGRTALDTQASYVRALAFGLLEPVEVPAAAARLVDLIHERGDRLATGFLSTGMLLPTLADAGHPDLAYRLLTQTGEPSWLEMLARGATTIWENWDNVDAAGRSRPGSLNHYSKGAFARFLHTHVAGLRQVPGSVGWQEVMVAPVPGGGLTWAQTTLTTTAGRFEVRWERGGEDLVLTATIPAGVQAHAVLPGAAAPAPLAPGQTTTLRAPWAGAAETRTDR